MEEDQRWSGSHLKKNNNIVLYKATNSLHYVDLLQENTLYTTLYQPLLIFTTV